MIIIYLNVEIINILYRRVMIKFDTLYVSKYISAFLKKSIKENFLHFTLMQHIIASWLVTCFSVCNVNELEK